MKRSTNSRAAVITVFIPVVILLAVICIIIIHRSIELPTEDTDYLMGLLIEVSILALCISCIFCGIIAKRLSSESGSPAWIGRMAGIEAIVGIALLIPAFIIAVLELLAKLRA